MPREVPSPEEIEAGLGVAMACWQEPTRCVWAALWRMRVLSREAERKSPIRRRANPTDIDLRRYGRKPAAAMSRSAWNDDSHSHLPVTYMSSAASQSCGMFRITRPQSKQIEPAGNLSRSSK